MYERIERTRLRRFWEGLTDCLRVAMLCLLFALCSPALLFFWLDDTLRRSCPIHRRRFEAELLPVYPDPPRDPDAPRTNVSYYPECLEVERRLFRYCRQSERWQGRTEPARKGDRPVGQRRILFCPACREARRHWYQEEWPAMQAAGLPPEEERARAALEAKLTNRALQELDEMERRLNLALGGPPTDDPGVDA